MAIDLTKFRARFIEEAREHLNNLNQGLLSLKSNPADSDTLHAIFRAAHTIKGSARMMKLVPITEMAHKLEEVLDGLRGGSIPFSPELADILFEGIDAIADMVDKTAADAEISLDTTALGLALEGAAKGESSVSATPPVKPIELNHAEMHPEPVESIIPPQATPQAPAASVEPFLPPDKKPPATALNDQTIRVNTVKLDELIKLSGEIVTGLGRQKKWLAELKAMERLTREALDLSTSFKNADPSLRRDETTNTLQSLQLGLKKFIQRLKDDTEEQEQLTHDLQDNALNMRMLPLSTLFESYHRTVRDLSKALEKKVTLLTEGGDTELDKKMIEKLNDPLFHMLRNALDHGIEKPEVRLQAGKTEEAAIKLCACYEGESVLITLSDDGAGISLPKIKEKCRQKKIFGENELELVPESELINLIFHPGFSTTDFITDISGRGVGMDVVKRNIVEQLKGDIQVKTQEGVGTTFYLRVMLTLAVMRVLLISVADMAFGLPANSIRKVVRVAKSELIDVVDKKAIRLREQLIGLTWLHNVLGLPIPPDNDQELYILVTTEGGGQVGLIVDAVLTEDSVVIKPLPPHMQNLHLVSGVTTTGHDEIIPILNATKIVKAAQDMKYEGYGDRPHQPESRPLHVLVVDDSFSTREIEKNILEAYGYRVTLAADGIEALEQASGGHYDVIVTDVEMPRLDGFSLTARLRSDKKYEDVPIILVTSRDSEADKKKGMQIGANAYIVKGSFEQSNLLETIRNLVG